MSRKIILIKQELLLLVYELNRSGLLAENEKIRPILAQLEKLLLCDLSPSNNDSVYFFFQAEDGIRDRDVTGVQTCALPISQVAGPIVGEHDLPGIGGQCVDRPSAVAAQRSEERRVGKECRSRMRKFHLKKNK